MELFKNPYIVAIIVAVCGVVFYLGNTGRFFGKFVNKFFPCNQNPANPFPCFGQYDIVVMVIAVIVGVIFFGILVFDFYKLLRP